MNKSYFIICVSQCFREQITVQHNKIKQDIGYNQIWWNDIDLWNGFEESNNECILRKILYQTGIYIDHDTCILFRFRYLILTRYYKVHGTKTKLTKNPNHARMTSKEGLMISLTPCLLTKSEINYEQPLFRAARRPIHPKHDGKQWRSTEVSGFSCLLKVI